MADVLDTRKLHAHVQIASISRLGGKVVWCAQLDR